MQIEYYKDNGGRYHWRLIGEDGVVQAVSAAEFPSEEAARASAGALDFSGGLSEPGR